MLTFRLLTFRFGKREQMRRSRFPYAILAAMLIAEFAVQGAETTRGAQKEKVVARNGSSAPQTSGDIVLIKACCGSELFPLRQAITLIRD
jgi:hypothetical protein